MELILEKGRGDAHYWRDLWRYRELFQVLAWRDVAVRYRQTAIGVTWALVRPSVAMVIFSVIFGRLARWPSEGAAPYPLMVFAGLLPWTFFASALTDASNSLVSNAGLISKVYFPRMIVPAATVVVAFVDFLISLILLMAMMIWYRFVPGWQVVLLPIFVAFAMLVSLGPGLWVTALNVKYRDFRYVIPVVVQFGLYVSPVGFSSAMVPEPWRPFYALNPMVGVIDGFRWCLLGGATPIDWRLFGISGAVAAVFLWMGIAWFRRTERSFADVI